MNNKYLDTNGTSDIPAFHYQGIVLDPAKLKYSPHPDIIHPSVIETGSAWENPLAKYYMYYAPHDAPGGICLAPVDRRSIAARVALDVDRIIRCHGTRGGTYRSPRCRLCRNAGHLGQ